VRGDEIPPRHAPASPRSGSDAMPAQNVSYGLKRQSVTQVGQRTNDAI